MNSVILIVDTTGGNAIYSASHLQTVLIVASTIEEARRFLDIYTPTLVIIDPIADRREGTLLFNRVLRAGIPVIIQTLDDPIAYFRAGALDVFSKPLRRDLCHAAVKRWLSFLSNVDRDALHQHRALVQAGPKPRVALVDDSVDDAVAVTSLYGEAFDVSWIPDVNELAEELVKSDYDLVLMDLFLAGHNGIDVLRRLQNELGINIPVVFHSGLASETSVSQAYQAGASAYIEKSMGPQHSQEVLTRLMMHVADGRAIRRRAS